MTWKNDQVSASETAKILEIAQHQLNIKGDYVEFGCYAGDTSLLLAELLRSSPAKTLWIYDSFEGLPPKSSQDESVLGAAFQPGALSVSKHDVKARFLRANLPVPIIKKAWFKDLTEADLPHQISFAFLDGDFYGSICDSLKLISNHMNPDGMILIHDYLNPSLPGVAQAVNEYLQTHTCRLTTFETIAILQP